MLASLDPLGMPLASQVVAGNEADDPLYEPAIKQVRTTLNQECVLYVGDCKMAASGTRAVVEDANDFYLMPLSATIATPKILDNYLNTAETTNQIIEPIYRFYDNNESKEIAKGFEITEVVTGKVDDKTISWQERRLIICSINYAQSQEKSLNKRLKKAKKEYCRENYLKI